MNSWKEKARKEKACDVDFKESAKSAHKEENEKSEQND